MSQQPKQLVSARCPQAYGCFSIIIILLISLSFAVTKFFCCKIEEASVVCLQPLSVDLWLQVPIMAANFRGLAGYVSPPQPAVVPVDLCVYACARRETK